jgi:hypothetical protein
MSIELLLSARAINRALALSKIQRVSVVLWFLWLKPSAASLVSVAKTVCVVCGIGGYRLKTPNYLL